MKVVNRPPVEAFAKRHAWSKSSLTTWHVNAKAGVWSSLVDLRKTFPSADYLASGLIVFDVMHNKVRLVARVDFAKQLVIVVFVFTHDEYVKWCK
jgi:mRNA-degrading endonuclease HigB of HigAB toxin-antitoxin module